MMMMMMRMMVVMMVVMMMMMMTSCYDSSCFYHHRLHLGVSYGYEKAGISMAGLLLLLWVDMATDGGVVVWCCEEGETDSMAGLTLCGR